MKLEEVTNLIQQILPCDYVEVDGDGHHFFVKIVSPEFEGLTRLQRHRLIKDGLKKEIASNELHALSITTAATPEEWQLKNK
ncbi:BolA/IbaG family iron-sulfur metabolism protein [Neisseriaceae bacterium PsAf]|nr:BolA/IbaG family iron-sulfur metabolism protein [Neisseriaceae bacterium PsAf]MCV2502882.1 BolA/IbaG family iron-sulfur metabolism protein [Neisseriaceae bacterium]